MSKETIDTIRAAEQAANQLEKDALTESERILEEARERAKELTTGIIMEAQNKAQEELNAAREQEKIIMAEAHKQAEEEIAMLHKLASEKKQEAVEIVLSELYPR